MRVLAKCGLLLALVSFLAVSVRADEIRLKDGKKLYGVIVGYEDNMFRVKTDYGFVLVEKDKIAAIIPATPSDPKPEAKAEPKKDPPKSPATKKDEPPAPTDVSAKEHEPATPKISSAEVHPTMPAAHEVKATAPTVKDSAPPAATVAASTPPPQPKAPEPPPNREEVQGNSYVNFTHSFRMYKAPSWNLIEGVRGIMPNAIVAMGTQDESTLLVVGQEPDKAPLAKAAPAIEKRLGEIYQNYHKLSEHTTTVAGQPAVEYKYTGTADSHDWSGTLVVVSRGDDTFTILGMTYAQSDLIQIQQNVIARAIGSMDFNVHP
jgi:hypothetical protein